MGSQHPNQYLVLYLADGLYRRRIDIEAKLLGQIIDRVRQSKGATEDITQARDVYDKKGATMNPNNNLNLDTMYHDINDGRLVKKLHAALYPEALPTFTQFLDYYIDQHDLKRAEIIGAAHFARQQGYRYLNGSRPIHKRDTIIRLCIAMGMQLSDVQYALCTARFAALDEADLRDCVIILGIRGKRDLATIQEWLTEQGLPPIIFP